MSNSEVLPLGPFKLVSCNPNTNLASGIMGQALKNMSQSFTIKHVRNAENLESLVAAIKEITPDIIVRQALTAFASQFSDTMFTQKAIASIWKPADQVQLQASAREAMPETPIFVVPHDILAEDGPNAVIAYLEKTIPEAIKIVSAKQKGLPIETFDVGPSIGMR